MASVSKRPHTRADGSNGDKWIVRYVDAGGAHRQKSFDRKKEADAYRLRVETEMQAGAHVAYSQSATVRELVAEYLEAADARQKAGRRMGQAHRRSLGLMFGKHVVPHLGAVKLCDLSWHHVDTWAKSLSALPTLSPSTVKRAMHVLKVAVDYAIRREWVGKNVVAEVMREYRGGEKKQIRTFSKEEVRAVLTALEDRPKGFTDRSISMLRCYVYIAAFCGLRWGEISGLPVENIDLEARLIRVRHNLTAWDEVKGPKTKAGVRDVPMPAVVADLLREWLAQHYVANDRGLAFRVAGNAPLSPQNFHRNYWQKLLQRAGLEPAKGEERHHFHALRHFCASAMIDAGVPLPTVATLLGHSAFDVTLQVYAHTIAGGQRRLDALEGIALGLLPAASIAHPLRTGNESQAIPALTAR